MITSSTVPINDSTKQQFSAVGEPFLMLTEQPDTYIQTIYSCILLVISPQAKASGECLINPAYTEKRNMLF